MAQKQAQTNKRRKGLLAVFLPWFKRFGFALVVLVLIAAGGVWVHMNDGFNKALDWGEYQFAKSMADAGFRIENVLVEGREYTDAQILLALINVQKGDPLFAVNPKEARALLQDMEWVRQAHVERRLPNTLYIELKERKPMALWKNGGNLFVIDSLGDVIHTDRLGRFDGLAFLAGISAPENAPELFEILNEYPDVFAEVEAAAWIGERRWDLQMKDGVLVKTPEVPKLKEAISLLAEAQAEQSLLNKDIHSIDLREPGRIVIRTKPGEAVEYFKPQEASFNQGNDI